MYIENISFTNNSSGWSLEQVDLGDMTLLVGASGVGKTRILKSILDIKNISRATPLNGVAWEISFKSASGSRYQWSGEYEYRDDIPGAPPYPFSHFSRADEAEKPKLLRERLSLDGTEIIARDSAEIIFDGNPTVKLAQTDSVIALLKEEEKVKDAYESFSRIIYDDNTGAAENLAFWPFDEEDEERIDNYDSLEELRASNEQLRFKIYALYKKYPHEFQALKETFTEVFPYVTGLKMEPLKVTGRHSPRFFRQTPVLQIREKGVDSWIEEFRMSSGMLRTLIHMAELHLCADSTLILIDEFENSLGINCIDEITTSILTAEREAQFILTSHHPYIINQISPKHWKLVTRKGGRVHTHDMDEFNLSASKHKAFTQLMNIDLYQMGVEE